MNLKVKRKAPIEHLFGKHEWCDIAWCYSKELDKARDQLRLPTAKVVNPIDYDSSVDSLDAVPTAATAPTPHPAINAATGEVEVAKFTATEVINPAASATVATTADSDSNSRLYSASSCASEENFERYQLEFEEEDEDLLFFKNLCTEVTDNGLETMVFSVTDLDTLKKEKNFSAKEDSKYFRCEKANSKLYKHICEAIAPYLTNEKLCMFNHLWRTQLNEAMSNSISSYAPKPKLSAAPCHS